MSTVLAPRRLQGVVLLAAQTARSQAYIQTLVAVGLLPERVIVMGSEAPPATAPMARRHEHWSGILLHDLDEPIAATCERAGVTVEHVPDNDANAAQTHQAIMSRRTDIVIYSGVGGQIVSQQTLHLGPKFLHMHSGWLPEYRGSTTIYYALLRGQQPAVSAIILDQEIDTGPVVARRHYPRPPGHLDLDRSYDAAIRADLLAQVLGDYARVGQLSLTEIQDRRQFAPYYVIHPVLKHLSVLALAGAKCP